MHDQHFKMKLFEYKNKSINTCFHHQLVKHLPCNNAVKVEAYSQAFIDWENHVKINRKFI